MLIAYRFSDSEKIHVARAILWNEDVRRKPVFSDGITHALRTQEIAHFSYGLTWVFEDDVEGAAAFKVSVALA